MTAIVWFRQDLRVADNPALAAAAATGSVLPVYILDDATPGPWRMGGASRWWLHHSLVSLRRQLGTLVLLRGESSHHLKRLVAETKASHVFWNRCYEPSATERDGQLEAELAKSAIDVQTFNASLLHEPWQIKTSSGEPFQVFTPFWRTASRLPYDPPLPRRKIKLARADVPSDDIDSWELTPSRPNWAADWNAHWTPGEKGAHVRLSEFFKNGIRGYSAKRNRPDLPHTSRLSPHLHFGEISPRQIAHYAALAVAAGSAAQRDVDKFMSEIGWREFAHHLLFHFPELPSRNWRQQFDAYPWRSAPRDLKAWQRGLIGYPLVDAGMRELWHTGWMHNRIRMVTASFLIKHLRIDWRQGEVWFWDTLVDADLANNAAGWQWVAGSGADAAPYFRIFNPVLQGRKFDPDGDYVRRWCPELARLPTEHIHAPHDAPADVLKTAEVHLGKNYPSPIVDHNEARDAALTGYARVRR